MKNTYISCFVHAHQSMRAIIKLSIPLFSLLVANTAESRMIYRDTIFKAQYNGEVIYGSWNQLDDRACAVISRKAIFGKVGNDRKSAIFGGKRINISEHESRNYSFNLRIPEKWWNSSQSKKCTDYTSYSRCFVNAGTPYYSYNPDEKYTIDNGIRKSQHSPKKIFKDKTMIFVEAGLDNNPFSRDGKNGLWSNFSFDSKHIRFSREINSRFLVLNDNLTCNNKSLKE